MIPRPTYDSLLKRITSDLAAIPLVLRTVLAAMWARVANGMHGHLDWIFKQNSPLTCDLERLYDYATLYHVERLLATASIGNLLATGNQGAQLLADSLVRGPNGLDYKVLAAVALGAGNTIVAVRCVTPGAEGNLAAGVALTLIDPVPGINSTLTVGVDGLTGGAADELVDAWRMRIVDEWRTVVSRGARSGKPEDYRYWAKSAHPSVTGALVQPHALGIGTVVVRPICNSLANRLPTQAVLDAVSAYYLNSVAPAVADWRVVLGLVHPVTLIIHLLPAADTQANRDAISSALNALILSKGGADIAVQSIPWSEVDATIAVITTQYVLDESVPIVWAVNEIPVLQPISWI